MAKYVTFKVKVFDLKKDALAWAKKIKKSNAGGGTFKIETNYQSKVDRWEAVVLRKQDG